MGAGYAIVQQPVRCIGAGRAVVVRRVGVGVAVEATTAPWWWRQVGGRMCGGGRAVMMVATARGDFVTVQA